MKILTEIRETEDCTWSWRLKVILYDEYNIDLNDIVEPYFGNHISYSIISGRVDTLESAKIVIKNLLNDIKKYVIDYKNEIKKEIKKEKQWRWDDNNNEFKEIQGGC